MKKSDFHFDLPPELIAQTPLAERSASRLLVVDAATQRFEDRRFTDLVELLSPGDLLVFNDTRVLPARLYGRKDTGGAVEILIERITSAHEARAQLGVSKKPKAGGRIVFDDGSAATVIGRELSTGNTVEVKVDEDELRQAMAPAVRRIVEEARLTLAEAPPELTHDVLETGMFLTGGGSLLRGLDMLLAQECEVPVHVVERPLETVVTGAGRMLEHLDDYRSAFQLLRRVGP